MVTQKNCQICKKRNATQKVFLDEHEPWKVCGICKASLDDAYAEATMERWR
jgi:hypothetical protein